VLLAGVALWSLGTLVAPPAAHAGLLALCASRVIVRGPVEHRCVAASSLRACVHLASLQRRRLDAVARRLLQC